MMIVVVVSGSLVQVAQAAVRRCKTLRVGRREKVKGDTARRHVYHLFYPERKHNVKVWREKDERGGGMRVRRKAQILLTAHRNTQSLSPGHTNTHTYTCLCFGKHPKALQPRSILLLTSFSLCYPPLLTPSLFFHLPDTAGTLSSIVLCASTKGMSTHKCSMLT